MSRLEIKTPSKAQGVVEELYRNMERRIAASPPGLCPVDMALNFLNHCHAQSCGKCVPCRIGLSQLINMIREVLEGEPDLTILDRIEKTAQVIMDTADCAIGIDAAQMILVGLKGFREDYEEHILHHRCLGGLKNPVPCVALCPAGVDVPGYVGLVDDAINIRGLKRYAVDHAGSVPQPACAAATGKTVAVVGGGPGGLSAAYYLALMGHKVTVYERRKQLGGMLVYGIPSYRLPRELLKEEIGSILSLGIEVHTGVDVGTDITFDELQKRYDCLYISIGAHTDKKAGIEGENSRNVISAVELLRRIGDDDMPDFTGKSGVVIGGGNVAMDVTRSSIRLGAKKVTCVYRRRQKDMTALPEEVEGAVAEGAELLTLQAPLRIENDETGSVAALWTQPQLIGEADGQGRPRPSAAALPERRIPADIVIMAVGQGIETHGFEQTGIHIQRGGTLLADSSTRLPDLQGVFAGGDCVTGPATVIRAIAAGKAAAANIDEYLGFHHEIVADVQVPDAGYNLLKPKGRVNCTEREASERKHDFICCECGLTEEEVLQEASRCLRCDHFGYGNFKGGRVDKW